MGLSSNAVTGGVFLGVATGLLVGLSRSPVAGVAVTGLLAAASGAVAIGADTEELLELRWKYFRSFTAPFVVALLVSTTAGVLIRSLQPSPAQQYVDMAKKLKLDDKVIAEGLAKAMGSAGSPATLFDTGFALYSEGSSQVSAAGTSQDTSQGCAELQPSPVGYGDEAFFAKFVKQGPPFLRLAEFIDQTHPKAEEERSKLRLQLLRVGYYGICGR